MQDWEIMLQENLDLFQPVKRIYTPEELQKAYFIYNGYYNRNLKDTGCGSCRRSVIGHLIKIAEDWRNSHPEVNL